MVKISRQALPDGVQIRQRAFTLRISSGGAWPVERLFNAGCAASSIALANQNSYHRRSVDHKDLLRSLDDET